MNTVFLKRLARAITKVYFNCPVIIKQNSKQPPKKSGCGYYFTNKSGDIIHSPSAYRRAWGKPIYNKSTLRVTVGDKWIPKVKINNLREVTVQ